MDEFATQHQTDAQSANEVNTMGMRDTYNAAIQVAKGYRMDGAAEERDGKLYFHGTVQYEDQANKIWDAIKTVPSWRTDIVADIKHVHAGAEPGLTYTVKAGDTLSKIAKELLGNANAYMAIFDANKDQLTDPNKIQVGQVLKIPAKH